MTDSGPVRLHHVAIAVTDLDRSIEWYRRVLGLGEERRRERAPGAFIVHLANDDMRLELVSALGEPRAAGADPIRELLTPGKMHIGVRVEDVDAFHAHAQACGAETLTEPADDPVGHLRTCFVRDPDGTMLEMTQVLSV